MYKDKILKFASEQSIEVLTIENNEQKTIRRQGDLSKYFSENDTIEFDDSTAAFCNNKIDDNVLQVIKNLNITVYRDGSKVDLKKEPFKVSKEIITCVVSFFGYGS